MLGFERRTWLGILALVVCIARVSPRFISQSTNYTILEDETVTIECTIEGLGSDDMVIWQGNQSGESSTIALNGKISGSKKGRYSVIGDKSRGHQHLVIKNAVVADEGLFICELFGDNAIRQHHRLTVNIPASVTISTPGFLAVHLGDPVMMTCEAHGKPTPMITWSKTGGHLSVDDTVVDGMLMIPESTIDDAGEYFCAAENGIPPGPAVAFVEVLVEYAPSVEVDVGLLYVKVSPSSTISLICTFDAVPHVEVIWRHNDTRINFDKRGRLSETSGVEGDHVMQIMGVMEEDLGKYECVGGNNRGQAIGTITVRAEPHDLQIRSDEVGLYSDQYVLEWAVDSHNPLVEFELKLQQINDTNSTSWMSNTVPAPEQHATHHSQQYTIKELNPDTLYKLLLRARNTIGFSEWLEFEFNTNAAGNPAPLVLPTRPTPEPKGHSLGTNAAKTQDTWLTLILLVMASSTLLFL